MAGTLLIWMLVCFFIYKHLSVIDELKNSPGAEGGETSRRNMGWEFRPSGR